jgi:hypothetical protein
VSRFFAQAIAALRPVIPPPMIIREYFWFGCAFIKVAFVIGFWGFWQYCRDLDMILKYLLQVDYYNN